MNGARTNILFLVAAALIPTVMRGNYAETITTASELVYDNVLQQYETYWTSR